MSISSYSNEKLETSANSVFVMESFIIGLGREPSISLAGVSGCASDCLTDKAYLERAGD